MKIGRWKTDRVASYDIGVDNVYTGPNFKEKTEPRLHDRNELSRFPAVASVFASRAPKYA